MRENINNKIQIKFGNYIAYVKFRLSINRCLTSAILPIDRLVI